MIDLSIIIVNYKTEVLLKQCIESIYRETKNISFEVIVVDNNSNDNSEKIVKQIDPQIQWYDIGYNSGFARANNFGIRKSRGNYVLLLNSDTEIINNALEKSLEFYKREELTEKIGLLSCKLLFGKDDDPGYPQLAAHHYFPSISRLFKESVIINYFYDRKGIKNRVDLDYHLKINAENGYVEWIAAAFALCNAKLFKVDNLFLDEDFFMYSEDVEWNYKVQKKGYKNYYLSETEIYHYSGASSTANFHKRAQIIISDFLFVRKSYSTAYYLIYTNLFIFNTFQEILYEKYLKLRKKPSVYDQSYAQFKMKISLKWIPKVLWFRKTLKKLNYLKYDQFA